MYFNVTNPSGNIALIEPVLLDGMLAEEQPISMASVPAIWLNTIFLDGVVQNLNEIYDDGNDYNPVNGVWTCPANARYNLNCSAFLTNTSSPNGWNSVPDGMLSIGVCNSSLAQIYCGMQVNITQPQQHIYLTAIATGIQILAGVTLCVKVLNQSGTAYTTQPGDYVRFSVQRIRV